MGATWYTLSETRDEAIRGKFQALFEDFELSFLKHQSPQDMAVFEDDSDGTFVYFICVPDRFMAEWRDVLIAAGAETCDKPLRKTEIDTLIGRVSAKADLLGG